MNLCLKARKSSDLAIWKIDNPEANVAFERRTHGMLTLESWVDISTLDSRNSLFEVCRRGFVFPVTGSGFGFTHGNMTGVDIAGPKTFILCNGEPRTRRPSNPPTRADSPCAPTLRDRRAYPPHHPATD